MVQLIVLIFLVGVVWFAVKGTKAIRKKSFKRGLKFIGLSVASFLAIAIISGIMANTPQAKEQAAQQAVQQAADQKAKQEQQAAKQAAQAAKDKAEADVKAKEEAIKNSPEGKYNTWVQSLFSAWDGSVPRLKDVVKANMNDPSSFKHVETTYIDHPNKMDGVEVFMKFRGTNAFGGTITNRARAFIDYKTGNMTWNMME